MSQALYRKWRPLHWEQVIGQPHVVQTLRNAIAADRVAHAYLFAGPRGTGKTTTARLLAKAVNCLSPELAGRPCNQCEHCKAVNQGRFLDLIEIDAASNTSVDDVRDLRDKINFSPNQGHYKVYIIDEVHMLSTAAFNALLKTLEEPPPHAIFILATTEVHKIPATVLSRCQRHEFRRIPVNEIVANLKVMAADEKIQIDEEALVLVARQATGAMRDAISLLDQLASAGQRVTLAMAQDVLGTATSASVLAVVEALLNRQPGAGLDAIHAALDAGSDPRQFARQVVDYLRSLLLVAAGNADQVEATPEVRTQLARHAQALPLPELLRLIPAFNQAAVEIRASWQPALALELAFLQAVALLDAPAPTFAPPSSAGVPAGRPAAATAPRPPKPAAAAQAALPPQPAAPEIEQAADLSAEDASLNQRLNENWAKVISLLRERNATVYALVNSIRSRHLQNGVLTLGFASDVLQSQVERPANLELAQAVVSQVMGMSVIIRCRVITGKHSAPPPDVDSDGMVAAALRDLGGEIVDMQ
ncbi:MAG TPA: DNA polymerase III subunit gamma/tau [Anaerolineales bacterium]|nr:DNA polymerase III subunit gamma/tau [Anaerolineales bacterium]